MSSIPTVITSVATPAWKMYNNRFLDGLGINKSFISVLCRDLELFDLHNMENVSSISGLGFDSLHGPLDMGGLICSLYFIIHNLTRKYFEFKSELNYGNTYDVYRFNSNTFMGRGHSIPGPGSYRREGQLETAQLKF